MNTTPVDRSQFCGTGPILINTIGLVPKYNIHREFGLNMTVSVYYAIFNDVVQTKAAFTQCAAGYSQFTGAN